jgi:hypothetical protein
VSWNASGYYDYNTDDNFVDSLRPSSLTERDVYIEYEEYQTNAWPYDMTSGPAVRWVGSGPQQNEISSHWYYYEMADSAYRAGSPYSSHDDITADDRRAEIVYNGTMGTFPQTSWTRMALAAWSINPTNLRAWFEEGATESSRGGWDAPRFSGTHPAGSDNESAGQAGVWVQQDTGRLRNILIRRYTEPEPSVTLGGEETF